MTKEVIISRIRALLGRPTVLLWKENGESFIGEKKLSKAEEKRLYQTHEVQVINWIEY